MGVERAELRSPGASWISAIDPLGLGGPWPVTGTIRRLSAGTAGTTAEDVRRAIVIAMAKLDEALDEGDQTPVVKAFGWLPRWWSCDLAKFSMALDDR
jgi:hypothetical protein